MNDIDRMIDKINNDFKIQLGIIVPENVTIEDIANAILSKSQTREQIVYRWKSTIDNINKNLNENYEYPTELKLMLIEHSIEHPTTTSNVSLDDLADAIKNMQSYEEVEEEDDYSWILDRDRDEDGYNPEPKIIYVEQPSAPKPSNNFWTNAAIMAGTTYLSYKAGRKIGKWLM